MQRDNIIPRKKMSITLRKSNFAGSINRFRKKKEYFRIILRKLFKTRRKEKFHSGRERRGGWNEALGEIIGKSFDNQRKTRKKCKKEIGNKSCSLSSYENLRSSSVFALFFTKQIARSSSSTDDSSYLKFPLSSRIRNGL